MSTSFAQPPEITVAAASDLTPTLPQLSDSFLKEKKIRIRWIPGSSGSLARQIAAGAPYDAFLSANEAYIKSLTASGHLKPSSVRHYATGRLALFAKRNEFRTVDALRVPAVRHVAIANPAHAPYGIAARDALQKLGLWDKLQPKFVYGESVQQTLQLAESGNAEIAFVSWSHVRTKGGVLIDGKLHAPLRQTGAAVTERGRLFLDWIVGPSAQSILGKHGFERPTP